VECRLGYSVKKKLGNQGDKIKTAKNLKVYRFQICPNIWGKLLATFSLLKACNNVILMLMMGWSAVHLPAGTVRSAGSARLRGGILVRRTSSGIL
jgi:hypothetical protein